jgi:hypothetical protein
MAIVPTPPPVGSDNQTEYCQYGPTYPSYQKYDTIGKCTKIKNKSLSKKKTHCHLPTPVTTRASVEDWLGVSGVTRTVPRGVGPLGPPVAAPRMRTGLLE